MGSGVDASKIDEFLIENRRTVEGFQISDWEGLMDWLQNEEKFEKFGYLILYLDSKSV